MSEGLRHVMRLLSIVVIALLGCDAKEARDKKPQSITVFAASSLKEVVTDIANQWATRNNTSVKIQFEASSTLARQIQEGSPADLFITAAPEWLDQLKTAERTDWLSNSLVLVVRKEVGQFDLAKAESLALANEQVPAGKYAKAALAHLGIKIPERTIYGSNVRDVLSKVSEGAAQAGVVYATDARMDPALRIAQTFPPESHPKIFYSAGLLSSAARGLYDALHEPWAMKIARDHGFIELQ